MHTLYSIHHYHYSMRCASFYSLSVHSVHSVHSVLLFSHIFCFYHSCSTSTRCFDSHINGSTMSDSPPIFAEHSAIRHGIPANSLFGSSALTRSLCASSFVMRSIISILFASTSTGYSLLDVSFSLCSILF